MTRLRLLLLPLLLLASLPACTKTSATHGPIKLSSNTRAIVGGALDLNAAHQAVVFIEMYESGQVAGFCTGTLITSNIVLTAGHCVADFGTTGSYYGVFFDTDNDGTPDSPKTPCWFTSSCSPPNNVSKATLHPSYNGNWGSDGAPANDIAFLKLSGSVPSGITPIPYLTSTLASGTLKAGATVEFVGYGNQDYPGVNCCDSYGQPWGCSDCPNGTRFHVSDTLDSVCSSSSGCSGTPPGTFSYTGDQGPCSGDSGGPAFLTLSGQEYVAGVTSYGDAACQTDGVSTSVPYFDSWLAGAIGTLAANGAACTSASACQSGFCVSGVCCNKACTGSCSACTTAGGASANGTCTPLTGTSCDDLNPCTTGDSCQSGACVGTGKTCPAPDSCHAAGTCISATGACPTTYAALSDGTPCSDGSACTVGDSCQGGACVPGAAINTCPAPSACKDSSVCDTATGTCAAFPNLADGTSCDDSNACTVGDHCQSGACVSGTAKTCAAPEACHAAGVCDTATGACTYALLPNGSSCDDHNSCTANDQCSNGTCAGTPTANACPEDACHTAGTCDPATGLCSGANKANGTACDDGDATTTNDQCASGLCVGTPVGADPCYGKANGTSCDDGNGCTVGDTCQANICVSGTAKTCPAPAACHKAGQCNWETGECVYPVLANQTACDDGDSETTGDVCLNGKCVGTATQAEEGADAGSDGSGTAPAKDSSGCGCASGGSAPAPALLFALGALALVRRRGN